jgi:hypothetical protein
MSMPPYGSLGLRTSPDQGEHVNRPSAHIAGVMATSGNLPPTTPRRSVCWPRHCSVPGTSIMPQTQRLRLSPGVVAHRQHTSVGGLTAARAGAPRQRPSSHACDACGKARAYRKDCRATCLSIDRRVLVCRSACTTMSHSVPRGTRRRKRSSPADHLDELIWVPAHTGQTAPADQCTARPARRRPACWPSAIQAGNHPAVPMPVRLRSKPRATPMPSDTLPVHMLS